MPESPDSPGIYALECSCGTWELTGTAAECLAGMRVHMDDHVLSPTPAQITPV